MRLLLVLVVFLFLCWLVRPCVGLPSRFDWFRSRGLRRPPAVKQTRCGACWAIATCTTIGARLQDAYGRHVSMDVACVEDVMKNAVGSRGCNGGSLASAFAYARDVGLLAGGGRMQVTRAMDLAHTDRCTIKNAIVERGPLAAHMIEYPSLRKVRNATTAWRPAADELPLNGHAVTVFGWDDLAGGWLVLNSWGSAWGEDGVGLVAYGAAGIDSLHVLDGIV